MIGNNLFLGLVIGLALVAVGYIVSRENSGGYLDKLLERDLHESLVTLIKLLAKIQAIDEAGTGRKPIIDAPLSSVAHFISCLVLVIGFEKTLTLFNSLVQSIRAKEMIWPNVPSVSLKGRGGAYFVVLLVGGKEYLVDTRTGRW